MSIKESMHNLSIVMQQKNLVFVTNNIHEVFIDYDNGRKIYSLQEKIAEIAKNKLHHSDVKYYSHGNGWGSLLKKSEYSDEKKIIDHNFKFKKESFSSVVSTIANEMDAIEENNQNIGDHNSYIIDFGDIFMDKNNNGGDDFNSSLQLINYVLTKQRKTINQLSKNENQTKIIFIMRDASKILDWVIKKNVEYGKVAINNPDPNERRNFFENMSSKFTPVLGKKNVSELREEDSFVQGEAVALTHNMSIREIMQLTRIRSLEDDVTFKELYQMSLLKSKTTMWEKINVRELNNLEHFLGRRVFGQNFAIKHTAKVIRRAFVGLTGALLGGSRNSRPRGVLFYCGPTGVGKTELVKSITEFIFGDNKKMIRFDMSEFSQEQSDQRLIGAPPGYVGYDSGGELTNAIQANPDSVLLFDEIEKSHHKILDTFLQILEDGRLTSAKGELMDFSQSLIIFTSNIGSSEIIGQSKSSDEKIRDTIRDIVIKHFNSKLMRPEILNRIGKENIVPFNFVRKQDIYRSIIKSKLKNLDDLLKEKHNITICFDDKIVNCLTNAITNDQTFDEEDGVRGMVKIATKILVDPLVNFLIDKFDMLKNNKESKKIKIEVFDGNAFEFELNSKTNKN